MPSCSKLIESIRRLTQSSSSTHRPTARSDSCHENAGLEKRCLGTARLLAGNREKKGFIVVARRSTFFSLFPFFPASPALRGSPFVSPSDRGGFDDGFVFPQRRGGHVEPSRTRSGVVMSS